jgi:hypothetical protein
MWSVYSLSTQTSIAPNFGSPEAPQDFGSAQFGVPPSGGMSKLVSLRPKGGTPTGARTKIDLLCEFACDFEIALEFTFPRNAIAPRSLRGAISSKEIEDEFFRLYSLKKKGSIDGATGAALLTLSNVCVVKFALR